MKRILILATIFWIMGIFTINAQTTQKDSLIHKLEQNLKASQDKIQALNESRKSCDILLENKKSTIDSINLKNKEIQETLAELNRQLINVKENNDTLELKISSLQQQKSILEKQKEIKELEIKKLTANGNTQRQEFTEKIKEKESQVSSLQLSNKKLNRSLANYKNEHKDLAVLTEEQKKDLDSLTSLSFILEKNIKAKTDSIKNQIKSAEELKETIKNQEYIQETFKKAITITFIVLCAVLIIFIMILNYTDYGSIEYFQINERTDKIHLALYRQYNYFFRLSKLIRKIFPIGISLSIAAPALIVILTMIYSSIDLLSFERFSKLIAAFFGPIVFLVGGLNFIEKQRTDLLKTINEVEK